MNYFLSIQLSVQWNIPNLMITYAFLKRTSSVILQWHKWLFCLFVVVFTSHCLINVITHAFLCMYHCPEVLVLLFKKKATVQRCLAPCYNSQMCTLKEITHNWANDVLQIKKKITQTLLFSLTGSSGLSFKVFTLNLVFSLKEVFWGSSYSVLWFSHKCKKFPNSKPGIWKEH